MSSPNLSDKQKRTLRNCDKLSNLALIRPWSSGPVRCPWSWSPETWQCISIWQDWKLLSILPHGSSKLTDEPAYVMDIVRACERSKAVGENKAIERENKKIAEINRKAAELKGKR